MIISMPTTARLQQRYDHRLRNLVQRTGDVTVATDLGVPRMCLRAVHSAHATNDRLAVRHSQNCGVWQCRKQCRLAVV
jgi:hypothetical protein